ncbi:MAG: hypothetical protein ACYC3L_15615 [Gemmatimonadaceae bacterium]
MSGLLLTIAVVVAALFALWAISVFVYLVGAKMKPIIDAHERIEGRAAIWGWGVLYTGIGLVILFLLVRFVKFAWMLE